MTSRNWDSLSRYDVTYGVPRGGVVVDVQYVDDDCSGVGMFVVEYPVRQLVTLS